eukprot:TRINITY_DN2214_c0_g1_i3.p1 TRINITY_DN2214_c0_g1~~TRINITY_DN2214_c0_g1_i3.p1  ORF type:complete len:1002 (-),score=249.33 TRINITY_DN2214_c0_g1_i3:239-3211(-)
MESAGVHETGSCGGRYYLIFDHTILVAAVGREVRPTMGDVTFFGVILMLVVVAGMGMCTFRWASKKQTQHRVRAYDQTTSSPDLQSPHITVETDRRNSINVRGLNEAAFQVEPTIQDIVNMVMSTPPAILLEVWHGNMTDDADDTWRWHTAYSLVYVYGTQSTQVATHMMQALVRAEIETLERFERRLRDDGVEVFGWGSMVRWAMSAYTHLFHTSTSAPSAPSSSLRALPSRYSTSIHVDNVTSLALQMMHIMDQAGVWGAPSLSPPALVTPGGSGGGGGGDDLNKCVTSIINLLCGHTNLPGDLLSIYHTIAISMAMRHPPVGGVYPREVTSAIGTLFIDTVYIMGLIHSASGEKTVGHVVRALHNIAAGGRTFAEHDDPVLVALNPHMQGHWSKVEAHVQRIITAAALPEDRAPTVRPAALDRDDTAKGAALYHLGMAITNVGPKLRQVTHGSSQGHRGDLGERWAKTSLARLEALFRGAEIRSPLMSSLASCPPPSPRENVFRALRQAIGTSSMGVMVPRVHAPRPEGDQTAGSDSSGVNRRLIPSAVVVQPYGSLRTAETGVRSPSPPAPSSSLTGMAARVEDLPIHLQRLILSARIAMPDANANFDLLINIMNFKKLYPPKGSGYIPVFKALPGDGPFPPAPLPPGLQTPARLPLNTMHSELTTPGNPRKLFKNLVCVGRGGFGKVFVGRGPDGKRVAVKKISHTTHKEKRRNFQEVLFMHHYCRGGGAHPNIIRYEGCYVMTPDQGHDEPGSESSGPELWLVMEYVSGGTLGQAAARGFRFNDLDMAYIAREVLRALTLIHSKDYIHRDLKPDNLMFDQNSGHVKLIDFGLCVKYDQGHGVRPHLVGSPQWMSPEIIQRRPHTFSTDVWSMAACMQTLANFGHASAPSDEEGSLGSSEQDMHFLRVMFRTATVGVAGEGLRQPERWSEGFRSFLAACLERSHTARASPTQLLRHPFIKSLDEGGGYGSMHFRARLASFHMGQR